MTGSLSFVALDANWTAAMGMYAALADHMPGLVVEAREWRQARRQGHRGGLASASEWVSPSLTRVSYALPAGWFHTGNALSIPWLAGDVLRRARAVMGQDPAVWIFTSPYYLRAARRVPARLVVYHVLDDYRWYWPRLAGRTERLEARMMDVADLVVAVSRVLCDRLKQRVPASPERVIHLPNGVPEEFLGEAEGSAVQQWKERFAAISRPIFAYFGDPSGRVDHAMIRALATGAAGSVVVVGGATGADRELPPGVVVLPPVPRSEVPAALRAVDVLLIPQADTAFNRATCPRKLWEYCASGTPIVGSCLTEIDPARDGIRVAATPEEFVRHALDLASGGDREGERAARRKLAGERRFAPLARRFFDEISSRMQPTSGGGDR